METIAAITGKQKNRLIVFLFFVTLFIVGFWCARQYGIPYDEATMTQLGEEAYQSIFYGEPWAREEDHRYHGTVVELPIQIFVSHVFPLAPHAIDHPYVRHTIVFLLFCVGVFAFYFIARRATGDWRLALLGCVMLVISPRVFAHAFYNSRDIPTQAFFSLSILTLVRFLEKKTPSRLFLHAGACALALGVRMPSMFLVALTLLLLARDAFLHRKESKYTLPLLLFFVLSYLSILALTLIIIWPFLWQHPIQHFLQALQHMSTQTGGGLLFGHMFSKTPWFYIPTWIGLTTPPLYTAFFLAGCTAIGLRAARHPRTCIEGNVYHLIGFLWGLGPVLAIIFLRSGVFQEWRQVLFVYPGFILVALFGTQEFLALARFFRGKRRTYVSALLSGAILLQPLSTAAWMARNHPFENVYFAFPSSWIIGKFDLDYWGLSYRQAIQYVVDHDPGFITYYSSQNIAYLNGKKFFQSERGRLVKVALPSLAKYVIETNRPQDTKSTPSLPILHTITVDGINIVTIYKGPFDPDHPDVQLLRTIFGKPSAVRH